VTNTWSRPTCSDLDSYTAGIPEHIRASILRLSEQQVDEEEAEREALREEAKARRGRTATAGPSSRPEPRTRTVAFEEELDAEDLLDDETDALEARVRLNLREGEDGSSDGESYVNSQEDVSHHPDSLCMPSLPDPFFSRQDDIGAGGTEDVYLEQLYMSNPKAFDRDAATRRSKLRDQMRKQTGKPRAISSQHGGAHVLIFTAFTGWSDEQLEGWRIMLERNVSGGRCQVSCHCLGLSSIYRTASERKDPGKTWRPKGQPGSCSAEPGQ